ncbi:MAG: TIGR04222 domain-containing membrane protein [Planctomycetota bacterium]
MNDSTLQEADREDTQARKDIQADGDVRNRETRDAESLTDFAARVEAFEMDAGDPVFSFADRLARENNWTIEFADDVITEYKRFCILAMRAGHPVTPSEFVDQAWHLHLTHTRSYWDRFCQQTLGKPLHHDPTAGGSSEGDKFRDWYAETLKSYDAFFGQPPPADIWPSPQDRFRHGGQWRWVNVGRHWVVSKRMLTGTVLVAFVLGVLLILPGCRSTSLLAAWPMVPAIMDLWSWFPFDLNGSDFLVFYLVLIGIAGLIQLTLRLTSGDNEKALPVGSTNEQLTTNEWAVLAGGGTRLAHVGITRLLVDGCVSSQPGWLATKLIAKEKPKHSEGLENDLYAAIKSGKGSTAIMSAVQPHFQRIDQRLRGRGLRRKTEVVVPAAFGLIGFVLILGGLRLVQGVIQGEEVGLLVLMMAGFAIFATLLNLRSGGSTPEGKQLVESEKRQASLNSSSTSEADAEHSSSDLAAHQIALLGTAGLAGYAALEPLLPVYRRIGNSSSVSGCGAGCGAGCGGGGCGGGGCGGCGG